MTGGELKARLEALLAEARERGELAELAPLLRQGLEGAGAAASGPAPGTGDVPMRFGIVGASEAMQPVFDLLERVATSHVPVLVQGETGTGKELVARALHEYGPRSEKRFLAENCAAVPAELLESELFGHTKGSFTGAVADRPGHFVAADGGTVFLDEIGDMPLPMQAKLLRVLQDGEVRPVGSNKTVKVDVRIVAATHRDLRAMGEEGTFRQDLYFRLNVITIALPPLRERAGDIPILVDYFLAKLGEEAGRAVAIEPAALEVLEAWNWPGNVRELENEIRRAVALSSGTIGPADLSDRLRGTAS